MTRRHLLAAGLGLAGSRRGHSSPPKKWSPNRLGVFCHLGADEMSARKTLAAARAAGFRYAQIQFPWTRVDEAYLKALPGWLKSEGVRAEVLGAYVNCCQPEIVLMECRRQDLERAIELAPRLGSTRLVAWTGSHSADLMKADALNYTPHASDAILRFLEPYTQRLEQAKLTVALETYVTLACPDAPSLAALLKRLPACVGAVIDPPNLTIVPRFRERDQVLAEIFELLGDRAAVVHLKDFRLAAGGASYELPGPMEGDQNYPLFVGKILTLPGQPPLIPEHIKPEQFAEVRRKLLPLFDKAARS
jgi:sugar phosphate isomerase/epimerase